MPAWVSEELNKLLCSFFWSGKRDLVAHRVLVHPKEAGSFSVLVPKGKLGFYISAVKKQCLSLVKTHRLNVSAKECARIASSVCSGDDLLSPPDVSSKDYALHVMSVLENELSKAPAAEFEIFLCSLVGFCPPTRSRKM